MRPALHTLMFAGHALERVISTARELGFTGVVIATRPPQLDLDDPETSARRAAAALNAAGVEPVGLATPLGRLATYRTTQAKAELDRVRRAAAAAAVVGAGLVRLWAGGDGLERSDPKERSAALAWYRSAAEIIGAAGARTTLEVQAAGFADRSDTAAALADEIAVPDLGVAFDTGNLHASAGAVSGADVHRLGSHIIDVHVKDMRALPDSDGATLVVGSRAFKHTLLGAGDVRNDLVMRALAKSGYTGWIAAECECRWTTWDEAVAAAAHESAALRRLIAAAGAAAG